MSHKLLELTKKKWEELKKSHNMKTKGKLDAFFTKLTGINVGDHIQAFNKAVDAAGKGATTKTIADVVKKARALEKALRDYAKQKEFSTPEAKNFKAAVLAWAGEAKDYADTYERVLRDNLQALKQNEALVVREALKEQGMI